MSDLAPGLVAPLLDQYISTQSTVDPAIDDSQTQSLGESQVSQILENARAERNDIPFSESQKQPASETGSFYRQSYVASDYVTEYCPSQQSVQAESSQQTAFPRAPYSQYPGSQGYSNHPGFNGLGPVYAISLPQHPFVSQYAAQGLTLCQNLQFTTPGIPTGQTQFAAPPNTVVSYPSVQASNFHVPDNNTRRRRTEARRHICPICAKRFLRPSSLDTHRRIHTNETPFFCRVPGCQRGLGGNGFNVKSNCVRHEKVHIQRGSFNQLALSKGR